ncbi:subtilase-type protease inhibitor [Streptomyces sp. URMC 123]|uniref:subtilase-type protease inhibitor n=1 Tax=Streptomyces sp. URMC 123 TaxID=3423403 RepID=UPI003F1AFDAC
MRCTIRTFGVGAALTACALAGVAGTAKAAPAESTTLYAPSALVLTVGHGDNPDYAPVERAATLRCSPAPAGDHPNPRAACAELRHVNGDLGTLVDTAPGRICTKIWDPVVTTMSGVWEGRRVSFTHTFPNSCVMEGATGHIFAI